MRVLVCGGRDFQDDNAVGKALDEAGCTFLIEGGARGTDGSARWWAVTKRVPHKTYGADWNLHGKAAGPIRNQQMIDEGKPELVLAFPGGRGTADMVKRAKAAGIPVKEFPYR